MHFYREKSTTYIGQSQISTKEIMSIWKKEGTYMKWKKEGTYMKDVKSK